MMPVPVVPMVMVAMMVMAMKTPCAFLVAAFVALVTFVFCKRSAGHGRCGNDCSQYDQDQFLHFLLVCLLLVILRMDVIGVEKVWISSPC